MRVLIGAAAAALLFASSAVAQTPEPAAPAVPVSPNCTGFDPVPAFPDGATANAAAMAEGNELYQTWGNARLAKLQTCRAEIETMRAQLRPMEEGFTNANNELREAVAAWQAEVEEFNARGNSRRNRN